MDLTTKEADTLAAPKPSPFQIDTSASDCSTMPAVNNERVTLKRTAIFILCTALFLFGYFTNVVDFAKTLIRGDSGRLSTVHMKVASGSENHFLKLPQILFDRGIYNNDSFVNEYGIIPAYWRGENNESKTLLRDRRNTYGPCYSYNHDIDWEAAIDFYNRTHQPEYNTEKITKEKSMDLQGYCRPGFVIIGAGKCGTSSLYHYIASHPNVLEASQKQIHYFKYHTHLPLKWYYQHFPKTSNFLAAGALMSGEASPGYLPYPDVVLLMKRTLPRPRLIAIGRNPIERAYSSYKYNYVTPTIQCLEKGCDDRVEKRQDDDYYRQFLFSFEDMMRAELAVLRECFAPDSEAEKATKRTWGSYNLVKKEYMRRKDEGLPPLLDLDGFCYGPKLNDTVPRKQWIDLMAQQPEKVITNRNLHLTQAFIGRSLYLFPLEWWYMAFPKEHIYFVCTEELQDFSGESMNGVGRFLGLPRFDNFSEVVKSGAFNVGGHRGYDYEVSWNQLDNEHRNKTIPLSDEFRREVEDFIRPYNERLFELTGRRCNW